MSELDRVKGEIAYLTFWLGVVVVTDITLVGWLISASNTAAPLIVVLALAGVALLGAVVIHLHRRIERRIKELSKL